MSKFFKSTWLKARAVCKAFDLELATFETSDEVQHFFNKIGLIDYFNSNNYRYAFVDGISLTPKSPTDWYWTNSGEKVPYNLLWAKGEPNHANTNEICLSIGNGIKTDPLGFNDHGCDAALEHFICQKTVII